ncbi:hypothetical protein N7522_009255 [Penicillium canescens]|nr:hypothetical protein N7522_009255 [Penicillium canescens]
MSSSRPSKRQRICRACDQCRRRKSKCDGEQPSCAICRGAGRTCTYQNGGGRRGLPPGYVRSLETVLGIIIQHVPNSENAVHDILSKSRNNSDFFATDPAKIWRKSRLAKEIPKLLDHDFQEDSMITLPDESEWDNLEMTNTPGTFLADTRPTSSRLDELVRQPTPRIELRTIECVDSSFPVDTIDMLQTYFTHTHCWFPILERHDLFRTMHTGSTPGLVHDNGSCLALWAVVAFQSCMENDSDALKPNTVQIEQSIHSRIMVESSDLKLGHVQALVILVLLRLKLGDIQHAWRLVGLASRMLGTLPTASKKSRYCHTFHGCVLLDNILSALMDKSPSFSLREQEEEGPVKKDSMEEWDVWSSPQQAPGDARRNTHKGPLRALSIFNDINHLMVYLGRILYLPADIPPVGRNELSVVIQAGHRGCVEKYPHNYSSAQATPPVLTLHLVYDFVMLTLLRRNKTIDMSGKRLMETYLQSTIRLLELYLEMDGSSNTSPLLICFASQCRQCLHIIFPEPESRERRTFENHLAPYLPKPKTTNFENLLSTQQSISDNPIPECPTLGTHDTPPNLPLEGLVQPSALEIPNIQLEAPAPPLPVNITHPPLTSTGEPAGGYPEGDGFDALFEEMVTSIPANRQEPIFAQNLGFCAGDLDRDFLEQLQRPPDG